MAQTTASMKQTGARNISYMVERMEWSNKMDLMAYGNEKGEVVIQRLNWQKVVTFPSPGEDVMVRSLSWQWDETVLAVAYSNGKVALLDAETEDLVSGLTYDEDIKKVYFSKPINTSDYRNSYPNSTELTFDFFLPQLPALNGIGAPSKSIEDHKSFAKGSPCFLVVILTSGKVHLLLLGALKAGSIDLTRHVSHPNEFSVYDVRINGRFDGIYALVRDGNQLKVLNFHNEVLHRYLSPMLHMAVYCANILETKNYINDTIQCILEAWETVVLEMDNKLTHYASTQSEGSLSADFLELLVFGYATHEIEEFLMDELTEKGLKKLATSVDLSYATLQSLVTKQLQSAAINMFYFLNTTKGFGRITYFFESLISSEAAQEALRICGAFLMKVLELQQVIEQCVSDIKLFFCWLSVVIVRLHQHDLTDETTQLTPEDIIYLANYLNNFEDNVLENDNGTTTTRKFNLEKVAQYLANKDLAQESKSDMHHLWNKLLVENDCLRDCTLLYPHEKQTSLIQQRDKMQSAIDDVFNKPNESISASFKLRCSITCGSLPSVEAADIDFVRSSYHINENKKTDIMITTTGWQEALILEFHRELNSMKCTRIQLTPGSFTCDTSAPFENLRFIDLQCYNENIASMLLQSGIEKQQAYFVQFPLEATKGSDTVYALPDDVNITNSTVAQNVLDIIDASSFKSVEGAHACTLLAVSGSRKIATILSDGKKRVTLFEMEVEEEDDEADLSQNSTLEISKESITSNI